MGSERAPVNVFMGVPGGFKGVALTENKRLMREVNPHGPTCFKVKEGTRNRWKEVTGLEPQDSRFTLIVPIHNEERYLQAALGAIARSDIPSSAHVNFVFVTNDCTDSSPQIVDNFLGGLGEVQSDTFELDELDDLRDTGLSVGYKYVKCGKLTFTHVDTSTRSQSNAFNIGSILALSKGHKITISVDANNFLESHTIAQLYGTAHRMMEEEDDGTVLITGVHKSEMLPRRMLSIVETIKKGAADQEKKPEIRVAGCLMAWDSEFFHEVGGIPKLALVDYGTGVLARLNGRRVKKDEEAAVWGYEPNTLSDRVNQYKRGVRGRMQIMAMSAEAEYMVRKDFPHLTGSFLERTKLNLAMMAHNPTRSPFMFLKYLMHEYAAVMGKREFNRDPNNPSWDPIKSTK